MSIKWAIVFGWLCVCGIVKADDLMDYMQKHHPEVDWRITIPPTIQPVEENIPVDSSAMAFGHSTLPKGISIAQTIQNGPNFQVTKISKSPRVTAPKIIRSGSVSKSASTSRTASSRSTSSRGRSKR
jgi:hypothetical protein